MSTLYISNDNLLTVSDLKNAATGLYINDATVSVTLVNKTSVPVAGQTWPQSMEWVAGSNGVYRATMEDDLVLTAGQLYTAKISVDAGNDFKASWELPLTATIRKE
jgi:hypothetical protein